MSPMTAQITMSIASSGLRHGGTQPSVGDTSSVQSELTVRTVAETGDDGGVGLWAMRSVPPPGWGAMRA